MRVENHLGEDAVIVCVCVRERGCECVREREAERVCVCAREGVCVCVRERECVCVRERVCVCEREREGHLGEDVAVVRLDRVQVTLHPTPFTTD